MKVLFYITSLTRSAAGLFSAVSGLARALAERGVEVVAVGGADAHYEADRSAWGPVRLVPYPLGGRRYGLHRRGLAALREERADLVHIHGIWSATSVFGRAAAVKGIPTVVSPHGMLAPLVLARRPLVKGVHAALLEKPLLRQAWVHALTEAERGDVGAFAPPARPRTFVVPNGVADDPVAAVPGPREGTLFLGRWHPVKQVVPLIEGWRALGPAAGPLRIAGWGEPDYEARVREAAAGAATVAIAGPLNGEAKSAAFARARFFILPSLREGLPMAVLEAIQHGCIPIITPESGLPELLEEGIALRMESDFSDFGSVVTQARAMSDEEAARRSSAARVHARTYAWPKVSDAMAGHYARILGEARR